MWHSGKWKTPSFKIDFTVVERKNSDLLPILFTSKLSGYVTSLGYDRGLLYPILMTTWAAVDIPDDHGLMLSFPRFNLGYYWPNHDCLDMHITDNDGRSQNVLHACGTKALSPQIYSSVQQVVINMTSGRVSIGLGFKMIFTFHRQHEIPQTLSDGKFNCSVAGYSVWRQHLHCNLVKECIDGRDESEQCPFSSKACRGLVASGSKCFFLVGHRQSRSPATDSNNNVADFPTNVLTDFTWNQAAELCEAENGQLASPVTFQEQRDVLKIWQYGKAVPWDVYIGLKLRWRDKPFLYKRMFRWIDKTVVYHFTKLFDPGILYLTDSVLAVCAVGSIFLNANVMKIQMAACTSNTATLAVCERSVNAEITGGETVEDILKKEEPLLKNHEAPTLELNTTVDLMISSVCRNSSRPSLTYCPCGHLTHHFLSCDMFSHCGIQQHVDECPVLSSADCELHVHKWQEIFGNGYGKLRNMSAHNSGHALNIPCSLEKDVKSKDTVIVEMFSCNNGAKIHYTLVCDFKHDCLDESDERFCSHPQCSGFECRNRQCVSSSKQCDGLPDCFDNSDEHGCSEKKPSLVSTAPPALIDFDGTGQFLVSDLSEDEPCPETHSRCSGEQRSCLPVYTRCNGYYDCIGREDEEDCDDVHCPGYYRCRESSVCVHLDHLCDGWPQCPQHDDELLCQGNTCPQSCFCQGLAFVCHGSFTNSHFTNLRYLKMKGVANVTLPMISSQNHHMYLIYLSVVESGVSSLPPNTYLPNLQVLDLSHNELTQVNMSVFNGLPNLKVLKLRKNPVDSIITEESSQILNFLLVMDLSESKLTEFDSQMMHIMPHLKQLNLSHSTVQTIGKTGFRQIPDLEILDMRGCPVQEIPLDIFHGLTGLSVIYSSNYRLCCEIILPGQTVKPVCLAANDELSTCENLLKSRSYQVVALIITTFALAGNAACLVAHKVRYKESLPCSVRLLITNTNIANFLMGIYAGIISIADGVYRGEYVLREKTWMKGLPCKAAGFLHLLSSHASLLTVLVISINSFRFRSTFLTPRTTALLCLLIWTVAFVLATIPLTASSWRFYGETGICFPLPASRPDIPGHNYHFGAVVLLNFVMCTSIVVCQILRLTLFRRRGNYVTITSGIGTNASFSSSAFVNVFCAAVMTVYGLATKADKELIDVSYDTILAVLIAPLPAALNPVLFIVKQMQEMQRKKTETRLLALLKSKDAARQRMT